MEALGKGRPGERSDDERGRREGEREASVLQRRGVGGQDVHGEDQTCGADGVEYLRAKKPQGIRSAFRSNHRSPRYVYLFTNLCGAIRSEAIAGSHHDKAQQSQRNHQAESNNSVPEVENFGYRHRASCGHDARYRSDDRKKGVSLEVARNVGGEVGCKAVLESLHEVQQPHAFFMLVSLRSVAHL